MVFLELKPNNPAIHKSINPSSYGMTVIFIHNNYFIYWIIQFFIFPSIFCEKPIANNFD